MMKFIVICCCIICYSSSVAQSFSGKVQSKENKTPIPFAKIYLVEYNQGTLCDAYGRFVLKGNFPQKLKLRISATGFETVLKEFSLDSTVVISLQKSHLELEEVTVVSSRERLQRNNSAHVVAKEIDALNKIPASNLGEALSIIPGVYNLSTGNGIAKPVIRGFQGTRIVSMLNGLRLENQQWGGDHGMGITSLGINGVEVLKGPSSLLYGADAMGGVVYYNSRPFVSDGKFDVELNSTFNSNSMGNVSAIFARTSLRGLKINAGGRVSSQADYQTPDGQFVRNSRFQEQTGKLDIGWHHKKWISTLRYTYSKSRVGIPGHTHDSIFTADAFKSKEQGREKILPVQFTTNHLASWENKWLFEQGKLEILGGFTSNSLSEFEEKHTIPALKMQLQNGLYTLKYKRQYSTIYSSTFGVQGMYQSQRNGGEAEERLLPNSNQWDNGVFAIFYADFVKWHWKAGLRYDSRNTLSYADTIAFDTPFQKWYQGVNFALGSVYSSKNTVLRFNVSSGLRMPHLSETLSNGVHHGTFRYEIGDKKLVPEKAIQLDVALEQNGEHLGVIVNPFINRVEDYIAITPKGYLMDGFPVYQYQQISELYMYGVDFGVHFHPHFAHFLHLESNVSFLNFSIQSDENIALIQQPRIRTSAVFSFQMNSKFKLEELVFTHVYFAPQKQVANYESPSYDYSLFDFGVNMKGNWKTPLKLQLGVKNILNTTFVNHLSRLKSIGIEGQGRNIYLKLTYKIKNYENQ